ncbi:unnamed protein product, partial [Choristocarpus tenellus]
MPAEESYASKAVVLLLCFVGLQGSYLTWGFFQEIVKTTEYGGGNGIPGEKFPSSVFIVLGNRLLALLISGILIYTPVLGRPKAGEVKNSAPMISFAPCSLSNVLSSWAQYACLDYISFPMQVVSKSCKVIPVMLVGKVVHGKSYPWIEYLEALAITLGVCMFSLSESHSKEGDEGNTEMIGLLLVVMYLTCDSFTSQWQ